MYHHCLLQREVGLSGLEIRTGSRSLWSICVYILILSSLHAGLLRVISPIPMLCLSFPAWCSLRGSSLALQPVGVWAGRGGCALCMGWALPDPSLIQGLGVLCVSGLPGRG